MLKIGAKEVHHDRYVTFHLTEVAVPRYLFRRIPHLMDDLWPRATPPRRLTLALIG